MAILYAGLSIGAITTLYPFALMISTGLKGATDQNDSRLVPAYIHSEPALLAKYLDDKYAGDKSNIASSRLGADANSKTVESYKSFLMSLPLEFWQAGFRIAPNEVTSRLTSRYQSWLRHQFRNIEELNAAYLEENVAFQTVAPPAEMFDRKAWSPNPSRKWSDWLVFKQSLPHEFRVPVRLNWVYQKYLMGKYRNQWSAVPSDIARSAKRFEEVRLDSVVALPNSTEDFRPPRYQTESVESKWFKYSGSYELPIAAYESEVVRENAQTIRREFAQRNFLYVLDYILLNGRAVLNTVIFCLLAIVTQLTVNPLAAYALSRYPIRASGRILLFLLATMAFPAEVAMIPSFLLLKDLGLLNTFAALVLPGAASGYMIFLLKGFFDSLPQELFEAAQLDGAPETTMMLRIAFPMSRPVLGYLALLAFMGAYGAFIYAFLVAQDQRIWTLMVWIYQLQNTAPKTVMMAALTLAALPTLLVFLFTQRVIMRGIVLPGER